MEVARSCAVAFFPKDAVVALSSEEYSFCCAMMFLICWRYSCSPSTLIVGPMSVLFAKLYHLLTRYFPVHPRQRGFFGLRRFRFAYTPYNPASGPWGRPAFRARSCPACGRSIKTTRCSAGLCGAVGVFWAVVRCRFDLTGRAALEGQQNAVPQLDDLCAGKNRFQHFIFRQRMKRFCGLDFFFVTGKFGRLEEIVDAAVAQRACSGQHSPQKSGNFVLFCMICNALSGSADRAEALFQHICRANSQAKRIFFVFDVSPDDVLVFHAYLSPSTFLINATAAASVVNSVLGMIFHTFLALSSRRML
nr:MAG TPA: hypothetical protein [Bacteriophage sp.]